MIVSGADGKDISMLQTREMGLKVVQTASIGVDGKWSERLDTAETTRGLRTVIRVSSASAHLELPRTQRVEVIHCATGVYRAQLRETTPADSSKAWSGKTQAGIQLPRLAATKHELQSTQQASRD